MPLPGRFFVTSLLPECEDEDLSTYFRKYGTIARAQVCREPGSMLSRGCGFVWMVNTTLVQKILMDEHEIFQTPVTVKRDAGPEDGDDLDPDRPPPSTPDTSSFGRAGMNYYQDWIFVGRLSTDATSDSLGQFFSSYGEVDQVDVIPGKRFGYIKMKEKSAHDAVLEEPEKMMNGNMIAVMPYENREDVKGARKPIAVVGGKGCYGGKDGGKDGKDGKGYYGMGGFGKFGPGMNKGAYTKDGPYGKGYGGYDDGGMDAWGMDSWGMDGQGGCKGYKSYADYATGNFNLDGGYDSWKACKGGSDKGSPPHHSKGPIGGCKGKGCCKGKK